MDNCSIIRLDNITNLSPYHISGYFEGIVGNLELMPLYYPGWVMRLYYDLDDRDPITKVYWPSHDY